MTRHSLRTLLTMAGLLLSALLQARASVIYVKPGGSAANTGASWATALATVDAAASKAANGDQIWVAAGTYTTHPVLNPGVALYGGFNGTETLLSQRNIAVNATILDGGGSGNVVTAAAGNLSLPQRIDGFTIQNAAFGGVDLENSATVANNLIHNINGISGSGISAARGVVIITNNVVTNNHAIDDGGGMLLINCRATVTDNIVTNNVSDRNVGGISCYGCPSVTVSGNTVTGNTCANNFGAGIGIFTGGAVTATVTNNFVDSNTAKGPDGTGGIAFYGTPVTLTLTGNTISNNKSIPQGSGNNYGGLDLENCTGTVAHNLLLANTSGGFSGGAEVNNANNLNILYNVFDGNYATYNGGGMEIDASTAVLANNLFINNTAQYYGCAITLAYGGNLQFTNNTVAYNTSDIDIAVNVYLASPFIANNIIAFNVNGGIFQNGGSSTSLSHNCVYGNSLFDYASVAPGPGDISQDPLFFHPAAGNYRLQPSSPCIDVGDNGVVDSTWTDLDGLTRIVNARVDMGAYEFQGIAQNVTGQVHIVPGGFRYNRATGRFVQTVTLTNTGTTPITGPISLVLDNLSGNATLYSSAGSTAYTTPTGSPYLNVVGGPAPGASISITLEFVDPSLHGITYTLRLLAGSGYR